MQWHHARNSLADLRKVLTYTCDERLLRPDLKSKFVQLQASERTFSFVKAHPPHGLAGSWLRRVAGMLMTNTDANTLLNMYQMHVLDTEQVRQLLTGRSHALDAPPADAVSEQGRRERGGPSSTGSDAADSPEASEGGGGTQAGGGAADTLGRLLDVGAGDGCCTAKLAPLFHSVSCTEVSRPASWRLRQRGFDAHLTADLDHFDAGAFDVISCLNVLDRCTHPRALLASLHRLATRAPLPPAEPGTAEGHERQAGGREERGVARVLLAVVLPYRAMVEAGAMGSVVRQSQDLDLDWDSPSWEESVNALVQKALEPAGFRVTSFSRVPYICQGDLGKPLYTLDDVVFVMEPCGAEAV